MDGPSLSAESWRSYEFVTSEGPETLGDRSGCDMFRLAPRLKRMTNLARHLRDARIKCCLTVAEVAEQKVLKLPVRGGAGDGGRLKEFNR
jgi:hypothetical protein